MICRTCQKEFDERPSLERRKRLADVLPISSEARAILGRPSPRCDACAAADLLGDIKRRSWLGRLWRRITRRFRRNRDHW